MVEAAVDWVEYLQGGEHGMCLAHDAHDDGTLFDGLLCVFYLEDATLRRAVLVSEQTQRQRCRKENAHNVTESLS